MSEQSTDVTQTLAPECMWSSDRVILIIGFILKGSSSSESCDSKAALLAMVTQEKNAVTGSKLDDQ